MRLTDRDKVLIRQTGPWNWVSSTTGDGRPSVYQVHKGTEDGMGTIIQWGAADADDLSGQRELSDECLAVVRQLNELPPVYEALLEQRDSIAENLERLRNAVTGTQISFPCWANSVHGPDILVLTIIGQSWFVSWPDDPSKTNVLKSMIFAAVNGGAQVVLPAEEPQQ